MFLGGFLGNFLGSIDLDNGTLSRLVSASYKIYTYSLGTHLMSSLSHVLIENGIGYSGSSPIFTSNAILYGAVINYYPSDNLSLMGNSIGKNPIDKITSTSRFIEAKYLSGRYNEGFFTAGNINRGSNSRTRLPNGN